MYVKKLLKLSLICGSHFFLRNPPKSFFVEKSHLQKLIPHRFRGAIYIRQADRQCPNQYLFKGALQRLGCFASACEERIGDLKC